MNTSANQVASTGDRLPRHALHPGAGGRSVVGKETSDVWNSAADSRQGLRSSLGSFPSPAGDSGLSLRNNREGAGTTSPPGESARGRDRR